ncbi:Hypothetical predicted protein, partial [Pelobates cultripes]
NLTHEHINKSEEITWLSALADRDAAAPFWLRMHSTVERIDYHSEKRYVRCDVCVPKWSQETENEQ